MILSYSIVALLLGIEESFRMKIGHEIVLRQKVRTGSSSEEHCSDHSPCGCTCICFYGEALDEQNNATCPPELDSPGAGPVQHTWGEE